MSSAVYQLLLFNSISHQLSVHMNLILSDYCGKNIVTEHHTNTVNSHCACKIMVYSYLKS